MNAPVVGAVGVVALLREGAGAEIEHEEDVVFLMVAPDVAAVVAARACEQTLFWAQKPRTEIRDEFMPR